MCQAVSQVLGVLAMNPTEPRAAIYRAYLSTLEAVQSSSGTSL